METLPVPSFSPHHPSEKMTWERKYWIQYSRLEGIPNVVLKMTVRRISLVMYGRCQANLHWLCLVVSLRGKYQVQNGNNESIFSHPFLGFHFIMMVSMCMCTPATGHCHVEMWLDTSPGRRTCWWAWTSSLGVDLLSLVNYETVRERKFIVKSCGKWIPY